MPIYLTKHELQMLSIFLCEKIVEAKHKMEQYKTENKKHEESLYTMIYNTFREIKAKVSKGEITAKDE